MRFVVDENLNYWCLSIHPRNEEFVYHMIYDFIIYARILSKLKAIVLAGAPQALLQSCLTFGAFSFILEGMNKQQPALALPSTTMISSSSSRQHLHHVLPPLAIPLPNELKESFSFFCQSIRKRHSPPPH